MRIFQKLFAFYVHSSIHVAFAVVAFIAITHKKFELNLPSEYWAFIFLGTITAYNFVKYSEIAGLHHRGLAGSLKAILIFSGTCFLLLTVLLFTMKIQTLLWSIGFALITLLYAIPFYHKKNLRMLSGVKIFVVALVWSGVTVIVPVVASDVKVDWNVWLTFFQRGLLVLALIMPFEIRDMQFDAKYLNTIPQRIGLRRTKIVGIVAVVVSVVFEILKTNTVAGYNLSLGVFATVLIIFLLISGKNQAKYFASFWVESLPILWWLIFMLY